MFEFVKMLVNGLKVAFRLVIVVEKNNLLSEELINYIAFKMI